MNSFYLKGYKFVKDEKYTWKFVPIEKLHVLTNLGYDNFLIIKEVCSLSKLTTPGLPGYKLAFNFGAASCIFNFKNKILIFYLSNNIEFLEHIRVKLQLMQ